MSNVIKSPHTSKTEGKKIIIRPLEQFNPVLNEVNSELNVNEQQKKQEIESLLQQAEDEAKRLKEQAELEIEQMQLQLNKSRQKQLEEIELLKEEAIQSGYQSGFEQGKEEAFRQYEQKLAEASHIIEVAKHDYKQMLLEAEPQMIDIAHLLAKRVLGERLELNTEHWNQMLKQVMQEVREHEEVKLYVTPAWYEHTVKQKEELKQLLSRTETLFIYPDLNLPTNGCVVETRLGRMEATLDRQLLELKNQLQEILEGLHE
ncbi:flagellar assembly protein FliH [Alkalihalobacillus sp. 1P02AB]|uniref:flagellar assembly protein FliH n=1 Tax=Alkalihalobacillus sp. 1P02AB TaxID=3132260 RepID=UPI0039A77687